MLKSSHVLDFMSSTGLLGTSLHAGDEWRVSEWRFICVYSSSPMFPLPPSIPPLPAHPLSMEKLSSMEPVPGAKKLGTTDLEHQCSEGWNSKLGGRSKPITGIYRFLKELHPLKKRKLEKQNPSWHSEKDNRDNCLSQTETSNLLSQPKYCHLRWFLSVVPPFCISEH